MQKKSLSRSLAFLLLAPTVLLGVSAFVLYLQIQRMASDAEWVEHSERVLAHANDVMAQIIDQQNSTRGFALTNDSAFLDTYTQAHPEDALQDLYVMVANDPQQQARVEDLRRAFGAWSAWRGPPTSVQIPRTDDEIEHERIGRSLMNQVRARHAAVVSAEIKLRDERSKTSSDTNERTKWIFFGLMLALAGIIAFVTRRQVTTIAATYDQALDREREFRATLEDQEWINSGQLKVAEASQGELSPEELATRVVTELAHLCGAVTGAFYIAEQDGLRCRGLYALDLAGTRELFRYGEGLLGQAARDKKQSVVRNLPSGYLRLQSASGSHEPETVVIQPLVVGGGTFAAVELGFVMPVRERVLRLLQTASESMAVNVRSAEYRHRLNDLLIETQRQAEELQAQQEELRVSNEELEEREHSLREAHGQMQATQARLEERNQILAEQRAELLRSQELLKQRTDAVAEASRYKSEFLANMSHELRTPLNSALILAKLLADNKGGSMTPEQVKFAETIYSAGNDLLNLINDILDLSKIEAGKLEVRPASTAIATLLGGIERLFAPLAKSKKLELIVQVAEGTPPTFETDPQRVEQILRNLLANALKFTEKGSVHLRIEHYDDLIAFSVRDTGIGIAREAQELIFGAFKQADGTTSRKYGGTGLGLSISRDLARMLGGDVTVQSAPGQGSTFTLTLPVVYRGQRPVPVEMPPASTQQRSRSTRELRRGLDVPATPSGPALDFIDDRAFLKEGERVVLVVEDDIRFSKILFELAHELGFACVCVTSGEEGFAMARSLVPAAIILDVNLPDDSGLTVLERMKRTSETRHIPIHVVSAFDHMQTALELGAVGYAVKPLDRERLVGLFGKLEAQFAKRVRRVLVVEDDAVQRDSIAQLLASDGVEIVTIATGRDALDRLHNETFDCIVLDLKLPDMSGFELMEKMATDEAYAFPPVIVYTGRSLTSDEEQALRRYSSSIIVKGARSPERLLDEVTLFLHQVEARLPAERQRMLRDARDREAIFEGRCVLVVEDDVRNVFALSSVLEPKGARVEIARNGREALDALAAGLDPDLVLMDIMMPEMDGITAMEHIRAEAKYAKLPIIALTAKAMRDDRERCLAAGANDYLAKPIDVDKLLSLARVWMRRG